MTPSWRPFALLLVTLSLALPAARAQTTVYWDGDGLDTVGGGTGAWSNTDSNWSSTSNGSTYAAWTNGDHAVFGGTGGTVTIGGGGVTAQNLTFSTSGYTITGDPLTLNSGSVLNTGSSSVTIGSVIAGSSGFTKSTGTSTLILTGDNTNTGTATINAGYLQLGNGGSAGSYAGNITLGGSSTRVVVNRSDTLTLTGNIGGTGTINITNGTLAVGGSAGAISGSTGNINVLLANTAGATLDVLGNVSIGSLNGGGTTGGNVNLHSGAALTFSSAAPPSSSIFAGSISGAGSLQITNVFNATTVTLTGTNTFTGGITVSGSNNGLNVANGGSIASNVTLASNAVLAFSGSGTSIYNGVVSGSGRLQVTGRTLILTGESGAPLSLSATVSSGGTLQIGNGSTTGSWAGSITLSASDAAGKFNHSDAFTHSGVITGTGSVTQSGSGTLTLSGTNTYTGGTTLAAGTLALGSSGAIGTSGTISFTGGTLQYTAANTTDYSSRFSTAAGQAFKIDTNGQTVTLATALTSSGATLTKSGAGTLTLSGANTYSGDTTVTAGTLALGHSLALQSSNVVLSGGALSFGSLTTATLGGASGNVALVNTNNAGVTLSLGNGTTDVSSSANLSGAGGFAKTGTSTVTLSGNSTYTGATTVTAGTLAAGSNTAFGAGTLVLNGGTVQASGGSVTLANAVSLTGNSTLGGNQALTISGALTLNGFNSLNVTNTATTTLAGAIGESTPSILIKQGSGELQLTGAGTYTGGTFIQAGTVRINNSSGSAFGTGAVTVASGATLAGSGSFSGALQLNGTYSPGNSPGRQDTGAETWAGGAALVWELNDATGTAGTNWDLLAVTGGLTLNATSANPFTLDLTSLTLANAAGDAAHFDAAADYSFTFVTTTTGVTGFDASAFTIDTTHFSNPFTGSWSVSLTNSGRDLALSYSGVSAVPEPSTYAAFAGLAALAGAAFLRRPRKTVR